MTLNSLKSGNLPSVLFCLMTSSKLSIFGNRFTNGFKGFLVSLTEAFGELWSNEHSQGQIWGLVAGLCVSFMLWIVWSVAYMGVSKNRGKTPKWMVKIMIPQTWDDLRGIFTPPLLEGHPYGQSSFAVVASCCQAFLRKARLTSHFSNRLIDTQKCPKLQ